MSLICPFSFARQIDFTTNQQIRIFFFFLSFVFLGVRVVCVWWWGGEPDMGKTFYLDSGCNNFIPNKPNSVSSMSLPWPCVNFRSWYHQEAINNGGNLSPTCKHYIWVIVWHSFQCLQPIRRKWQEQQTDRQELLIPLLIIIVRSQPSQMKQY
jgi:hypothetical protein